MERSLAPLLICDKFVINCFCIILKKLADFKAPLPRQLVLIHFLIVLCWRIPIYMELKFDVGVNIAIGLIQFPPMSALFDKPPGRGLNFPNSFDAAVHVWRIKVGCVSCGMQRKCGMYIGGMFERSANKLGPLICRDTYEQLDLPHLGASAGSAGLCRMPVIQFSSIRFITFTALVVQTNRVKVW